jgi:hypothetical protein
MAPYLDAIQNRATCQRGQERFEVFAPPVKRRVDQDAPLGDETICHVRAKQDAIAEIPKRMEAALGFAPESSEERARSSLAGNEEPKISAAADEGGSESTSRQTGRRCLISFETLTSRVSNQRNASRPPQTWEGLGDRRTASQGLASARLGLIIRLPVPLPFSWCIVAAVGAAPVISFAIMGNYFSPEASARANGALNTLHFGWAFVAQYATGLVLEQWPQVDGHYPVIAYQAAVGICVAIQMAALIWFFVPRLRDEVGPLMSGSRREFRSGPLQAGIVKPGPQHKCPRGLRSEAGHRVVKEFLHLDCARRHKLHAHSASHRDGSVFPGRPSPSTSGPRQTAALETSGVEAARRS